MSEPGQPAQPGPQERAGWAPPTQQPQDPWALPGAPAWPGGPGGPGGPPPRRTGLVVGLVVGGALLVVALLVGGLAVVGWVLTRADDGLAAPSSACDPVQRDEGQGISTHVGPGTSQPDVTRVDYDVVPPATGPHLASPVYPAAPFYTAADRPQLEQLVHNLEHGYTLVWFAADLPADQRDGLRELAGTLRGSPSTGGKLVVAEWDDADGALPPDRPVVMTHWTADGGVRQACSAASSEAVTAFVDQFPFTDSPEPYAP